MKKRSEVRVQKSEATRVVACACLAIAALFAVTARAAADDERRSSVGKPARIDQLVLPGSELVVKRVEDSRAPIVLRIVQSYAHGSAFRYDLVYYGLEPGEYDLREYLERRDGSTTDDVPPIKVGISALLPPGQILPSELESRRAPRLGGYRTLLTVGAIVWVVGILAILFARRSGATAATSAGDRPVSLADRLRPLVVAAMSGSLDRRGQAELERILLEHWRTPLNLENENAAAAIARLREHEEAGRLLRQLEMWLHQPGTANEVDVAALLQPYS